MVRGKEKVAKRPQVGEAEVVPITPTGKKPPEKKEAAIPQVPLKEREEVKPEEKPREEVITPPEIEEEIEMPPTKVEAKEEIMKEKVPHIPPEIRERLERNINVAKRRLEEIKKSISKLEEIVGFEVSPYKLVDAETSLISAEMKLKEGNVEEAENILKKIEESLDTLEAEVSEAEKSLIENWGAVENRIDIMLRVWGKAPANMLTMVPAGFRIAALERFRRLHPDRKLELRGDELIALEE